MTSGVQQPSSLWREKASEFAADRVAVVGLLLFVVIVLAALVAPWLAPQNPYDLAQLDVLDARLPPGSAAADGGRYLLGSDEQGRDLLSAILYGLRISLGVGVLSTLIAVVVGLLVGLLAAYKGGRWDSVIMRVVDIQLSFPAILIALILLAVLGQGVGKIIAALVTVQWAYYARTVRGAALAEKNKDGEAFAMHFGAALMMHPAMRSGGSGRSEEYTRHLKVAAQGAAPGSLLDKNICRHVANWGGSMADLRAK